MALTLGARTPVSAAFDADALPGALFRSLCRTHGEAPALRYKRRGIWRSISWGDYYASARAAGLALADLGCAAGDVVSVFSENRPEWLFVEHGARCMRFAVSAIAPGSSTERLIAHLNDARTAVLFVSDDVVVDAEALRAAAPDLRAIVRFDLHRRPADDHAAVASFATFLARGTDLAALDPAPFERAIDAASADGVALLQYTFGTTGKPKGVLITNGNLRFQIAQMREAFALPPASRSFSFVAYANIFERTIGIYGQLATACVVHFPENAGTVLNDLREVRPDIVFATPRFWEKLAAGIELFMRDAIAPARWAYRRAKAQPHSAFGRAILRNVRASLGLSEARFVLTGSASVSLEMLTWYRALGTTILDVYGLAETCGPCTLGTVTEVRLDAGGHVLVRGPLIAAGYHRRDLTWPRDAEGWFATGDCAVENEAGLRILGRRDDLIVNRHGTVAPGAIESRLRFSPYVYDVVVVGHNRDFLTALVMIDDDGLVAITRDLALEETSFADLIRTPQVRSVLQEEINRVNAVLRDADRIRDFRVIDRVIAAGDGELSPTLRLHRQIASATYRSLIEEMYP